MVILSTQMLKGKKFSKQLYMMDFPIGDLLSIWSFISRCTNMSVVWKWSYGCLARIWSAENFSFKRYSKWKGGNYKNKIFS